MNDPVTPSSSAPAPGPLLLVPRVPDHELLRRVGRGAYGEVWLARSVTGAFRAVKIVHRRSFDHARPFEREFEGIVLFEPISRRHESQVNILHVGRAEDCFYYVMELADDQVSGGQIHPDNYLPRTLKSDLMFHGRLPFEECVRIGVALTTALQHLHENGLVHRDVKPSNIIFVNGVPKLADIGLVTGVDATRSYVGTEGFAAPEGPGTPQADLYSLGKVLYEMSTGKDRQDFPELPTQLRELPDREGLVELNAVIMRACCHAPKDRYKSAAELRADLELLQSGKSLARLHRAEARLRFVQRAGALVTGLAVFIAAGWLWQARQTSVVRGLMADKARLADENRERIVRLDVANGTRLLDENDPTAALLWFSDALPRVTNSPVEELTHRIRIQQTLNISPRLVCAIAAGGPVAGSAFSPDGRRFALLARSLSHEGYTLTLCQADTGATLWKTNVAASYLTHLQFSQDGERLLISSTPTQGVAGYPPATPAFQSVQVRNVQTGELLFPSLHSHITCSAFSPDGLFMAVAYTNHLIQIRDTRSGALTRELTGHSADVLGLEFSRDGTLLASCSVDKTARLWDTASGQPSGRPFVLGEPIRRVTLSRDAHFLAVAASERPEPAIQVWDIHSGEKVGERITEPHNVRTLFFSPTDPVLLFTGGDADDVRVWDVQAGLKLLRTLEFPVVRCWDFSPDTTMVALGTDAGYVSLWETRTFSPLFSPLRHVGWVEDVCFSFNGTRLLTASDDGTAKIWILPTALEPKVLALPSKHATIEPADEPRQGRMPGPLVLQLQDGCLHLVDPAKLEETHVLKPRSPTGLIRAWAAGSTGQHWAIIESPGAENQQLQLTLWTARDGALQSRSLPHPASPTFCRFAPDDSNILTVADDSILRIWHTSDGSLQQSHLIPRGYDLVSPLVWDSELPAALLMNHAARGEDSVQVYDLKSGQFTSKPLPLSKLGPYLNKMRLSPDNSRLGSVGGDQQGRVLDLKTGDLVTPPFKHGGSLMDLDWSPDGKTVLTSGLAPEAKLWDATTGAMLLPPMSAGRQWTLSACFSADGRYIFVRNDGNFARVFDAASGEPVTPRLKQPGYVRWGCITSSNRLITAADPNLLLAWDLQPNVLSPQILSDYARLLSARKLSTGGVLLPISAEDLAELAQSLRMRAPRLFE